MKETLIIYLLIITFSLKNAIEFGKEIPFDIDNNNSFEFTFTEDGDLFIQVDFPKYNLLTLNAQSIENSFSKTEISNPGKSAVIPFKKGKLVKIKLSYKTPSNAKGIIWMNPSISEIKVDLNQKYEWKYDYKMVRTDNITYSLTYSIDNAEKDAILEFKYNDKLKISGNYMAPNPLKIFHKNNYINQITTYEIKKGESYKIIVSISYWDLQISPPTYIHFLPSFSFNFIEKESEKEGKEPEKQILKEEIKEQEKKEEKKEEIKHKTKNEIKEEKKEEEENEEEYEEEEEPAKTEEKEPAKKEVKKEEIQEKNNFLNIGSLSNMEVVCLMILGIAIIGIIIYLLCDKNKPSYNENTNGKKSIELELAKQENSQD